MKRLISAICVLFFLLPLLAQETYQKEIFISSRGDTLQYRLLQPENMKKSEKYPLVLFLHGAGERGNDNERQLTHGGQMFLNPVNREIPGIRACTTVSRNGLLGILGTS